MTQEICSDLACSKPKWARGFCKTHYEHWRAENLEPVSTCSVDDCDAAHFGNGYCRPHYMKWYRTGDAEVEPPVYKNTLDCEVDGCSIKQSANGLCNKHNATRVRQLLADQVEGTRTCCTCKLEKDLICFSLGNNMCRECDAFRQVKHNYGITREQYDALLDEQGGECAICVGSNDPKTKRLSVDHWHECDAGHDPRKKACIQCIRGLLCEKCNIGKYNENPKLLRAAAAYFESDLRPLIADLVSDN